jgi:hypothetical protein
MIRRLSLIVLAHPSRYVDFGFSSNTDTYQIGTHAMIESREVPSKTICINPQRCTARGIFKITTTSGWVAAVITNEPESGKLDLCCKE